MNYLDGAVVVHNALVYSWRVYRHTSYSEIQRGFKRKRATKLDVQLNWSSVLAQQNWKRDCGLVFCVMLVIWSDTESYCSSTCKRGHCCLGLGQPFYCLMKPTLKLWNFFRSLQAPYCSKDNSNGHKQTHILNRYGLMKPTLKYETFLDLCKLLTAQKITSYRSAFV